MSESIDVALPWPLINKEFAMIPLVIPDGYIAEGIDENKAYFVEPASGVKRIVTLPIYERSRCSIEKYRIDVNGSLIESFVVKPDPYGSFIVDLQLTAGAGVYWLIMTPTPLEG